MADSDDIRDAIVDNLVSGVKRKKIGDRETEYHDPKVSYEIAQRIAADEIDDDGPFLRARFE
jgi:hypothetical protein